MSLYEGGSPEDAPVRAQAAAAGPPVPPGGRAGCWSRRQRGDRSAHGAGSCPACPLPRLHHVNAGQRAPPHRLPGTSPSRLFREEPPIAPAAHPTALPRSERGIGGEARLQGNPEGEPSFLLPRRPGPAQGRLRAEQDGPPDTVSHTDGRPRAHAGPWLRLPEELLHAGDSCRATVTGRHVTGGWARTTHTQPCSRLAEAPARVLPRLHGQRLSAGPGTADSAPVRRPPAGSSLPGRCFPSGLHQAARGPVPWRATGLESSL